MSDHEQPAIEVPSLEQMRAWLDARAARDWRGQERAHGGTGWRCFMPTTRRYMLNEFAMIAGEDGILGAITDGNALEAIDAVVGNWPKPLRDALDSDAGKFLLHAAYMIAFDGADSDDFVRAVKTAGTFGVAITDLATLPTITRVLKHRPNVDHDGDPRAHEYREHANTMTRRLQPWIDATRARATTSPWPDAAIRDRADARLAERFLGAYAADCEALAVQADRLTDSHDQNAVGASVAIVCTADQTAGADRLFWTVSAPKKRRDEVRKRLFAAFSDELLAAGVVTREVADGVALDLFRAIIPDAFGEIEHTESLSRVSRELRRQRKQSPSDGLR